jgi:hypothetical protein
MPNDLPKDPPVARAWWQGAALSDFRERVATLSLGETNVLLTEISAALAVTQAQLETRGRTDEEWWRRARGAIGYLSEKRAVASKHAFDCQARDRALKKNSRDSRNAFEHERWQKLEEHLVRAENALPSGDGDIALREIIAFLRGVHFAKKKVP